MPKATNRITTPRDNDVVVCRGRAVTGAKSTISKDKFDRLREVILQVVSSDKDGVPFARLPDLVKQSLAHEELDEIGSIGWHTTCVKLEMEARGEIQRVEGSKPQRLRRG